MNRKNFNDSDPLNRRSRLLIAGVVASDAGVISTRVLQEFYVTATRKMGVAPLVAKAVMQSFRIFDVVQLSPNPIKHAIDPDRRAPRVRVHEAPAGSPRTGRR